MKRQLLALFVIGFQILTSSPARAESKGAPHDLQLETGPKEVSPAISPERELGPKSLEELIEELLAHNPELSALTEKVRALENRIPQAGALEDPRFEFALRNFQVQNFDPNADFMSGIELGLRQMVPWPGKLGLRKKIAASQFDREREEYLERLNQLVAKFKKAYYEYRFLGEAVSIHEKSLARLRGLLPVLEARYSAGETPQQDILKNKVEISSIQNTLIELKQRKKILGARLVTLLVRRSGDELRLKKSSFSLTPLSLTLVQLREIALRNRPWLKKSDFQIQEAELRKKLAKKELLPDFDFGAGYMIRTDGHSDPNDNRDMITLGFSLNLPVYAGKKQKKAIQEAVHIEKMEEYLQAATRQEILFEVEKLYYELRQLRAQVDLHKRHTIPQSVSAVEASRVNYQAEETDFLNVLTNEINLLRHHLESIQYRYEYEKKIAELEMVTGLPIHILNQFPIQEGTPNEENY